MFFDYLQVLVALACDLELDTLPCCAETHKWAWFRRYCMASRVAVALDKRTPLPRLFLDEVLHEYFKWFMEHTKVFHLKRYILNLKYFMPNVVQVTDSLNNVV